MKIIIKPVFFILLTVLAAANLFGQQASYSGAIGDSPVTFVTDIYSDGVGTAVYVYYKYDEPIRLDDGKVVKNKLSFTEKDAKKMTRAILTFDNYDGKAAELKGVWKDAKTGKTLDIKLKKDFETDYGSSEVSGEFIQGDALSYRYFKLAFLLADENKSSEETLKELEHLFRTNPTRQRKGRKQAREKPNPCPECQVLALF